LSPNATGLLIDESEGRAEAARPLLLATGTLGVIAAVVDRATGTVIA